MPDLRQWLEPLYAVRDFLEAGGGVLVAIGVATLVMWTMMIERLWYYRFGRYRRTAAEAVAAWTARSEHRSWFARQIRQQLIAEVGEQLDRSLPMIRTVVALCPLLGLLGTVTGMIEVFDVMAVAGSGNVRAMAAGVTKATIPTMAGMVAALSGVLVSARLERFAQTERQRLADQLTV